MWWYRKILKIGEMDKTRNEEIVDRISADRSSWKSGLRCSYFGAVEKNCSKFKREQN